MRVMVFAAAATMRAMGLDDTEAVAAAAFEGLLEGLPDRLLEGLLD